MVVEDRFDSPDAELNAVLDRENKGLSLNRAIRLLLALGNAPLGQRAFCCVSS